MANLKSKIQNAQKSETFLNADMKNSTPDLMWKVTVKLRHTTYSLFKGKITLQAPLGYNIQTLFPEQNHLKILYKITLGYVYKVY